MTIHGKILAILNLFGLIGLLCLAAMDFGKQQTWKYANLKADLVSASRTDQVPGRVAQILDGGLPLDNSDTTRDDQNLAELLGDPKEPTQTLKELFPQGPYVNTQVKQVERVQGILDSSLQQVEND